MRVMNTPIGKVFLSYARQDLSIARKLYNELRKQNIDVWFDQEDLLPGTRWEEEIRSVIKSSSFFLAVLSQASVNKKGTVQKELKLGLDVLREMPPHAVYLIPVKIDDCVPSYDELFKLQWCDLSSDWDGGISKLLQVLSKDKLQEKKPANKNSADVHANILLVDGERSFQHICKQVLARDGYNVFSALSGKEALEIHEKESIDLTIFEILLPDMKGTEFMQMLLLKGVRGFVIYTTLSEDDLDFSSWAADAFIEKSPYFNEFRNIVRMVLLLK